MDGNNTTNDNESHPLYWMAKGDDFKKVGDTKYVQFFFPDGSVLYEWFKSKAPCKILYKFVADEKDITEKFKLKARLNIKGISTKELPNGNDILRDQVASNTVEVVVETF